MSWLGRRKRAVAEWLLRREMRGWPKGKRGPTMKRIADWFIENKGPLGILFVAVWGGVEAAWPGTGVSHFIGVAGAFLVGAGWIKRDREKVAIRKLDGLRNRRKN